MTQLPRYVKVPVIRRKLPHGQLGESRKGKVRSIRIGTKVKGITALSTLVHEALHQMDHRLSERTVRQLEKAIVYLVVDNPDLFQKLYSRINRA